MSIRKSTIIEKAQHLVFKGKIKEAIKEWEKLAAETPNDGNIYNAIGDLHLKENDKEKATAAYIKAGEAFEVAAFELKSIALYKKALKLDPSRYEVHEKLAAVYAERGLISSAIEGYLQAARHHAKQEDFPAALAVYRNLSNLAPNNVKIRLEIGEMCLNQAIHDEAVEAYKKVRSIYESKNMMAEADEIQDILIGLDPAFGKPQILEKELEEDVDQEAAEDAPALNLGERSPEAVFADNSPENSIPEETFISEEGMEGFIAPESKPMAEEQTCYPYEHSVMDYQNVGALHSEEANENTLEDALTEVEVYMQYGLVEKAIGQLHAISKSFPSEITPYLKLKEIYTQQGMRDKTIETCRLLMARYEEQDDEEAQNAIQDELRKLEFPKSEQPEAFVGRSASREPSGQKGSGESSSLEDLFSDPLSEPTLAALDDVLSAKQPMSLDTQPASLHEEADLPSVLDGESPREEYVDLNEMLSESFNGDADALEHPLEQSGRSRQAVIGGQKAKEAEGQYDLGMAYKEMNMLPEAISAFGLAAMGERFEDATMMLAICHRDAGAVPSAVDLLEKALADPQHTGSNMIALKYELALLYELTGDKRSTPLFQEIYHVDPTFREVSTKYQHATRQERHAPLPASNMSDETKDPIKRHAGDQVSFL